MGQASETRRQPREVWSWGPPAISLAASTDISNSIAFIPAVARHAGERLRVGYWRLRVFLARYSASGGTSSHCARREAPISRLASSSVGIASAYVQAPDTVVFIHSLKIV